VVGDCRLRAVRAACPNRGGPTGWAEDRAGRDDYLGRRPVVTVQRDHADGREASLGEVRGEANEVPGIGTGEAVDRLVAVADHAQVGTVAQPCPQEPELRGA